jgi:S-methylmethionine-dependent homocysteine/selenocysteine methylase
LIFIEGVDLPEFAAFDLLRRPGGEGVLRAFYGQNLAIAAEFGLGMVIDTPTWRANVDWARKLNCSETELRQVLIRSVELLCELRTKTPSIPVVVSGCIGPRGDGYVIDTVMSPEEAMHYHDLEAEVFAEAGVDLISAITMTYSAEAIGIVKAAQRHHIPVAISFTVETDGNLPSCETLEASIQRVDQVTGSYPSYYLINCAHPSHFHSVLLKGGEWTQRIRGVLVNASHKSHAELNECTELDAGSPEDLAAEVIALRQALPALTVLGGCCGTDYRHIRVLAQRLLV